ncbi:tRNA lysidine(34) synthetase TilS [Patescibacteria group bacterium]|nr:tRNA lysidine(34) synthetase TilS [Patescibacteria group bacterium]
MSRWEVRKNLIDHGYSRWERERMPLILNMLMSGYLIG